MCLTPVQYLGWIAPCPTEVLVLSYRGIDPSVPRYWSDCTEVLIRPNRGIGLAVLGLADAPTGNSQIRTGLFQIAYGLFEIPYGLFPDSLRTFSGIPTDSL